MPFALAAAAALLSVLAGWTPPASAFDNAVGDWLERTNPASERSTSAVVLAIDDQTLIETGGSRTLRVTLARLLERLAAGPPEVTALDLTLADPGLPEEDARLKRAMAGIPNLVLASEMLPDGSAWQDPFGALAPDGGPIGHVYALPGPFDEVARRIPLEKVAGRTRRWALALEALRLHVGAKEIVSSPTDVRAGPHTFASRWDEGRPLRVRFRLPGQVETVSVREVLSGRTAADALTGRVVFVGVTSLSAIRDRLFTPVSLDRPMAGVEIHAQAFETMAAGDGPGGTLRDVPVLLIAGFSVLLAAVAAALMVWPPPRWALLGGVGLLIGAGLLNYASFRQGLLLPAFAPLSATVLSLAWCGAWRFFVVRAELAMSESARHRYQQAFHFVAHEMRTPLTAIQGSSELITRYQLPEDKRKQLGQMINSESKRLASMITTFLNVERLSAGQMELQRTRFEGASLVGTCAERAAALGQAKSITIEWECPPGLVVDADRELAEYALYNLLTNAIKYSPPNSGIRVEVSLQSGAMAVAVHDQGMGMTQDEVKRLFERFYRTERAEKSGIQGTGIGLSIVKEIVTLHGGSVRVESAPERGSTFTITLPGASMDPALH